MMEGGLAGPAVPAAHSVVSGPSHVQGHAPTPLHPAAEQLVREAQAKVRPAIRLITSSLGPVRRPVTPQFKGVTPVILQCALWVGDVVRTVYIPLQAVRQRIQVSGEPVYVWVNDYEAACFFEWEFTGIPPTSCRRSFNQALHLIERAERMCFDRAKRQRRASAGARSAYRIFNSSLAASLMRSGVHSGSQTMCT